MEVKTIHIHCLRPPLRFLSYGLKELELLARKSGAFSMDPSVSPCGYHWVVRRDGAVERGRPEERPGNHTPGFNQESIGVAVIVSQGIRLYSRKQREALLGLIQELRERYPKALVVYQPRSI